ncbi:MAG: lysophospholipid acyltransferase family protein [Polyangiales bacterium]
MTLLHRLAPAERWERLNRLYVHGQVRLTGCRWQAEVHSDIDAHTPYLFLQNHINHFDHVMMYNATPHFKQGMELERHFRYPVYGPFMKSRGTIPVRPLSKDGLKAMQARMQAELDQGHSLLAFPEGTRTLDGQVGPFRRGIFLLAIRLGVPIVPVTVTGSFALMRKGSWIIRPGQSVLVHCAAPIPTEGLGRADIPALIKRVREPMAARVAACMAAPTDRC